MSDPISAEEMALISKVLAPLEDLIPVKKRQVAYVIAATLLGMLGVLAGSGLLSPAWAMIIGFIIAVGHLLMAAGNPTKQ